MKINIKKSLCILMSLLFCVFCFASCRGTEQVDTTLVSENKWKDAVDTAKDEKIPGRLTDDELKSEIESVIREDTKNNSYIWNGDYSSLTDEQKDKIEDRIAKDKGIRVEITDSGIVYDKIIPTYEEIVKYVNDTVGNELKEKYGDDYVWDGNYSDLTDEQKDKIEDAINDDGYDVIVDDGGVISTPSDPVSKTVLSTVAKQNIKTFGGSNHDRFLAVKATPDGGYAAMLNTFSKNGDCSEVDSGWSRTISGIVKFNAQGEVQWKKFIGGNNSVKLNAMTVLADGSIVAVGETNSTNITGVNKKDISLDAFIIKYSPEGEQTAIKLVAGSKGEYFSSVAATPDGGFVAGGKAESSDGDFSGLADKCIKAVLFKYDKDCNIYWKRALNGGNKHVNFQSLAVNKDGDIFAACLTMSSTNDFSSLTGFGKGDSIIIKLDMNGERQWVKTVVSSGNDNVTCIACSPDGGCVVAGEYTSLASADGTFASYHNYGDADGFIIKYNKDGSMDWLNTVNGFDSDSISGIESVDGGYVVCGDSKSSNMDFALSGNKGERDAFVLLIDETGKKLNLQTVAGKEIDVFLGVCALDDSTFVVVGGTQSADGDYANLSPAGKKDDYISTAILYKTVKS